MATKNTTGHGKTEFVTDLLQRDPNATMASINEAWTNAGHDGSIGTTLFYSTKSTLKSGGSTQREVASSSAEKTKTPAAKTKAKAANRAAKAKTAKTKSKSAKPATRAHSTTAATPPVSTRAAKATPTANKGKVIDKVESEIDDAIFSLKSQGGFPEVEAALRTARRLLSRSHGE